MGTESVLGITVVTDNVPKLAGFECYLLLIIFGEGQHDRYHLVEVREDVLDPNAAQVQEGGAYFFLDPSRWIRG